MPCKIMASSFPRDELSLPAPSDKALGKHRGNCSLSGFSHSTVETAYRVEKTVTSVEIKRPFCRKFKERFLQELRLHLSSRALDKSHSGLPRNLCSHDAKSTNKIFMCCVEQSRRILSLKTEEICWAPW